MRRGIGNNAVIIGLVSLVAIGSLTYMLMTPAKNDNGGNGNGVQTNGTDQDTKTLFMYCAAGIKKPVAAAAKAYMKEQGVEVQLQYNGSGFLLNSLQVAQQGDLYLAADTSYIELAREKDLLREAIPLSRIRPVIAVPKGNKKNIQGLDDLLRSDVKVILANPDAASVGKLTKKLLEKSGHWDQVSSKSSIIMKPTVNEVAADIIGGFVDAGIVWDATVNQHSDKLEMIRVPSFEAARKEVTIGVLKWCKRPAAALKFARYLQAPEKGQQYFEEFGFEAIAGDPWAERPELVLFSGGVNRMAIKDTIELFRSREGVDVSVTYNGCGILVADIEANLSNPPDAYFACDVSFMTQVQDRFHEAIALSRTDMIIIVQNGNPHKIKSIEDLAQTGLKLGVADPVRSALGTLTKRMFNKIKVGEGTLYDAIQPPAVESATADILVNQLLSKGLDAAVVYQANVSEAIGKLEVVPIRRPDATATQPIAIHKNSKYAYLTRRLIRMLNSKESQERFIKVGFDWRASMESQ